MAEQRYNKTEFLQQLELLLLELPEQDRQDALGYYEDYFEEAGSEQEAEVIRKLGSPEKVAAQIKNEHSGNEQAEYTECGYSDGREGPNPNTPATRQMPEKAEKEGDSKKDKNSWIWIVLLIIISAPIWGGILSGVIGALIGVVAAIFSLVIALLALEVGLIVAGVACIGVGIAKLIFSPAAGILVAGIGAVLLAVGLLLGILVSWIFGKAIPAVCRFLVTSVRDLIGKLKGGKTNE